MSFESEVQQEVEKLLARVQSILDRYVVTNRVRTYVAERLRPTVEPHIRRTLEIEQHVKRCDCQANKPDTCVFSVLSWQRAAVKATSVLLCEIDRLRRSRQVLLGAPLVLIKLSSSKKESVVQVRVLPFENWTRLCQDIRESAIKHA